MLRFLANLALKMHPPEVRARFGPEMRRMFLEDAAGAWRRGFLAGVSQTATLLVDIARAGLMERFSVERASGRRSGGTALDGLRHDLRFAIRSLLRRPGFAAGATATLALGVGTTTAIFSVVAGVLLRPLPYAGSDRLVRLWETVVPDDAARPGEGSNSPVSFRDWEASATTFESMAIYARTRPTLTGLGEPEVLMAARVSPAFFRVMGAEPVLGRAFTREEDLPGGPLAVVISDGVWRERLGGRPDVIGTSLQLNGRPFDVVGVAPPRFDFPYGATVWLAVRNDDQGCARACYYVNTVGRLREGVSLESARAELRAIADRLAEQYPTTGRARTAAIAPLLDVMVGEVRPALLMLLGAVSLVLLIACANVANLLIVRGTSRADEMAVRTALGAGRGRIFSQLMTESLLLAFVGGAAGVALAAVGLKALHAVSPGQIPRLAEVGIDGTTVMFALLVSMATAVLFGLAPALQLARASLAQTLREDATRLAGSRRGYFRSGLLITEVALSLVLLVGAGLLLRSFAAMQRIDTGYETDGIGQVSLTLPFIRYATPDDAARFYRTLDARLESHAAIAGASLVVGAPLSDFAFWAAFTRDDLPPPSPGEGLSASLRIADHEFFSMMGVDVVAGRPMTAEDRRGARPVAWVNQRLARYAFGDTDPIGKQITLGLSAGYDEDVPRTIVGVVEDLRSFSLTGEVDPELYIPYAQSGSASATVLVRPRTDLAAALAAVRAEVRSLDADLPIRDPGTIQQLVERHTAAPRFYLQLLASFAFLAVALAAIGLYSVVAYVVARRSREIGLRMALGASAGDVLRLVLRQGFGPALLGAVIGLAAAFAGTRLLSSMLFGVTATDPLTLAGTTALVLAVAFSACLVPAARATRIPPAGALKTER